MFKGHPKGLYALALANTGERFGYYTMLAIFVLFLQAKFGFTAAQAGQFYGFFLAGVYFMPLIGGILADKFGYGKMVTLGIVVMFLGYLLMAVPASGSVAMVSLIGALVLVFVVVIFFWMSFHQNGLTLTWFARDYTANSAEGLTRIGFSLPMMTCIVIAMYSLFSIFQSTTKKAKSISAGIFALMIVLCIILYMNLNPSTHIEPQLFQQFNPFFVVLLTPISVALFGALAKKGKEPSTPKKIGMGMLIAACGFLVMALASRGLANPTQINGTSDILVSPNWLISTYLVLTFGELLLSPMGISFVSKVAPPKYKGMMMGFWFAATAVGNYLTSVIANIWESGMQLWMIWGVLIVVCVISAIFIFSILKRLEKATADC